MTGTAEVPVFLGAGAGAPETVHRFGTGAATGIGVACCGTACGASAGFAVVSGFAGAISGALVSACATTAAGAATTGAGAGAGAGVGADRDTGRCGGAEWLVTVAGFMGAGAAFGTIAWRGGN